MKKIYIVPNLKVVTVKIKSSILIGSKIDVKSTGGNGTQLGREDNSWDIWGNDDTEFDD